VAGVRRGLAGGPVDARQAGSLQRLLEGHLGSVGSAVQRRLEVLAGRVERHGRRGRLVARDSFGLHTLTHDGGRVQLSDGAHGDDLEVPRRDALDEDLQHQHVPTVTDISGAATITSGVNWDFVQAAASGGQGPLYAMNGTDTPLQWTGSGNVASWTASSGSVPNGTMCKLHANRVWVAGVSANPSRLYWSDVGDPRAWPAANVVDLDPQDGDVITGIGTIGPYLLVFKKTKTFVIYDDATGANRRLSVGSAVRRIGVSSRRLRGRSSGALAACTPPTASRSSIAPRRLTCSSGSSPHPRARGSTTATTSRRRRLRRWSSCICRPVRGGRTPRARGSISLSRRTGGERRSTPRCTPRLSGRRRSGSRRGRRGLRIFDSRQHHHELPDVRERRHP
jgi:hypothetical protein